MKTIKIYRGESVIYETPINIGAKGYFSVKTSDYITLPFSSERPIDFKLGDYVNLEGVFDDYLGGKLAKIYEIVDLQKPTYNTETGGYDYLLRLDAYYWKWKNKIFKYTPKSHGCEASWSLTAPLDVQMGVFLRNLKALGYKYKDKDFEPDIDSTVENKAVTMTYDNTNLLDALFLMADENAWNCDVWITDNIIHFGRNEFGDAVKIERDIEAQTITRNDSQGTYATRIYAFGSTRNIPTNYRQINEQFVVNGVVQKRLMLPADTPYIDAYEGIKNDEAVETVVVFDDVYPRRVGKVSDVHTRSEEVENEDGTKETITYYRYKDTGLTFSDKYIIEGEELKIHFQSGKLNGMEFGVIFNPSPKDSTRGEQLWEIVRNEDYGRPLPDDILKPENGDKYVLSGFDIQMVSDVYISDAEQELKEKAQKYADKAKKDDGAYPVTLRSDWVEADPISRTFEFGQRINLVDDTYFPNGRISRVLGWELNLDIPWDSPIYTIGESLPYSRVGEIEDKADALTYKGQTYSGFYGSGVYLIRVNDTTPSSDSNVYSARRSKKEFLSKQQPDRTPYPLSVGDLFTAEKGTQFGKEFVPGVAGGIGGKIDGEGNGELKTLRVREFLEATEYRHNRVSINVGNQWRAPGGGVIEEVIPDTDLDGNLLPSGTIVLHLEDGEIGAVDYDDICQGIFHDSATIGNNSKDNFDDGIGNFRFAGFFSSYFRITELIDSDSGNSKFRYTLRNDDKWAALYHPCAMMTFVAYGNFTKKDRQNSRYSTLTYERYLQDVNDWTFTQYNIAAQFGDLSNLKVFGLDMTGYSAYLDNVYFSGTIQQIEKAPLRMEIENPGGGILASGESTVINCRVLKGFDYVADDDLTWEILRDTGDADADAAWTQKQKVKDFAGCITLSHSSTDDDLSTNPLVKGTLFTFIAHSKNGSTVRASIILRPPEEGEKGEDAILVSISQSGVIRNGQGNIILYASVFKGGDDITDKYIPEQFSWIRDSGNADFDAGWNRLHKDYGNTVALTAEDVRGSAVFSCELESE